MICILLLLALPLLGLPQTYDMPIVLLLIVAIGISVYRLFLIHGNEVKEKSTEPEISEKEELIKKEEPIQKEVAKDVGKVRESAQKIKQISLETSNKIQALLSDDDKKEISEAIKKGDK